MMNGSPLGKYAAPAAAIASLFIIGAAIIGLIFGKSLGITSEAQGQLNLLAAIAAGALFGSSVAVNGYKAPLEAIHKRVDELAPQVVANAAALTALDPSGSSAIISAAVQSAASVAAGHGIPADGGDAPPA